MFLLGNKSDIEHESGEKAKDLASKYEIKYFECSAKEGTGVTDTFDALARSLNKNFSSSGMESTSIKPQVNIK